MARHQGWRAWRSTTRSLPISPAVSAIRLTKRLKDNPAELVAARNDRVFNTWFGNSVAKHKVPGYAIVTLSLKPEGGTPGDATAVQMDAIADLADRYSFGEIRVGHEQNLVLPHVAQRDLPAVWRALDAHRRCAAERESDFRYHLLPGSGLLQSRQCAFDSDRAGAHAALS